MFPDSPNWHYFSGNLGSESSGLLKKINFFLSKIPAVNFLPESSPEDSGRKFNAGIFENGHMSKKIRNLQEDS